MRLSVLRLLLCAFLGATLVSGCQNPRENEEKKRLKDEKKRFEEEKKKPKIPDQTGDIAFESFLGRLRLAVAKRDRVILKEMMTSDFGYRWDPPMGDNSPFEYWDQHNLWPELEKVLRSRFVPKGNFMVAPPEFVESASFTGYRVGLRLENGGWRFAYFISGDEVLP